jgi:hypothetical protein
MCERSLRKRLQQLEKVRQKRATTLLPDAFVEMTDEWVEEKHLVVRSTGARRCYFKEMPGPGPQITDFGPFDTVLYASIDEMRS